LISTRAKIDTTSFQRSLNELAGLKKDVPRIVRRVASNVVKDCVKLTPPFGGAPSSESFNTQRKIGQNAIKGDILGGRKIGGGSQKSRGIFFDIGDIEIETKTGYKISKKGGEQSFQKLFVTKRGEVYGCEKTDYIPRAGFSDMRPRHQAARSKITGRVFTAGSSDRTIGRTRFVDRLVTSTAAINQYLKWVYGRVGGAKHGWFAAIQQLGIKGIPQWIRDQDTPKGMCSITGEGTSQVSVTFENTVPYIQRKGRDLQIVKEAFKSTGYRLRKEIESLLDARMRKAKRA